jgi:hypothetical protein
MINVHGISLLTVPPDVVPPGNFPSYPSDEDSATRNVGVEFIDTAAPPLLHCTAETYIAFQV